jgi:beta-galactosidase
MDIFKRIKQLAILSFIVLSIQVVHSIDEWHKNPQVFQVNREPAHATLVPYSTVEEALALDRAASPWRLSLNGTWKFQLVDKPEDRHPYTFWENDYDVSGWDNIKVPGNS